MSNHRISKRIERYLSYKTEKQPDGQYKITIYYFKDNGNPVREIDLQRVKYITCSEQDLPVKTKEIKDIIEETKWRLIRSLHHMGATEPNVNAFLNQKFR